MRQGYVCKTTKGWIVSGVKGQRCRNEQDTKDGRGSESLKISRLYNLQLTIGELVSEGT